MGNKQMRPRDLFGVVVRTIGLGFVAAALLDAVGAGMRLMGLPGHSNYAMDAILFSLVSYAGLGVLFLASADFIVRIVYGRDR
jgi:hypothetical protein